MQNLNELGNTKLFRLFVEEGSKDAINVFFQNQMDLFYRVAFKYTKNAADAEDVLQASFLSIMDTAHQYKGINSDEEKLLQSWCLSVVVHRALMKIRSESNRKKRETGYSIANTKTFYEEEDMENQNDVVHQKVQKAILLLPEKYRIPIHLKYVEGFELDTIASILKLNASTLRSLIKRGLEKVSNQLKEENVTLSSVGLIGLIEALPVEKAPIAYEAIATKMFSQTSSARLLLKNGGAKASFFSLKIITGLLSVVCLTIASGFYLYNTKEKPALAPMAKTGINLEAGTNQAWSFVNPQDRNLSVVRGSWKWNEAKGLMAASEEEPLVVSLPIKPQKQPFMVTFEGIYFATLETKYLGVFLRLGWIKNNKILKVENKSSPSNGFQFNLNKPIKIKVYFYQNYICTFLPDNSYHLEQCDGDFSDGAVGLLSRNLMFKRITSKTFNEPPNEFLNAIKAQSKQPGIVSESWDLSKPLVLDQYGNLIH